MMLRTRIIPVLLLKNSYLVKGRQFKNHKYVGDPINAVKIYNEKEVDELIFLDVSATQKGQKIDFDLVENIASEAFMPFGYGGGIHSIKQIKKLFNLGVEKVVINSSAFDNPELIKQASLLVGSQSIVVSMDVRSTFLGGYEVYTKNATHRTRIKALDYAKKMQDLGAGELIVCSVENEGSGVGYDLKLLEMISNSVDIPVVALGGANKLEDFAKVINNTHVSAVAAGDMFVFYGKHRAVLITYPKYSELEKLFD
jgi:imidazole glycerol-phosphate synthase subunit HisF